MDEEQKLEQEALAHIDPEAIRLDLITETGMDEIADADTIEKMVAREVKTRTMAAKAIGSKIKTNKELEALKSQSSKDNKVDPDELDKKLDAKLTERLEKREIDSLEYPDELKSEIKKVAAVTGVSIKAAQSDPYIKAKIDAYEKEQRAEDASISRTNKSGSSQRFSFDTPPDVDVSTPEGQKTWEAWKEAMKKQGY